MTRYILFCILSYTSIDWICNSIDDVILFQLCFKKGDVITITQTDDEGWWEGTLHDKTGWFPANYVKECRITGMMYMIVFISLFS